MISTPRTLLKRLPRPQTDRAIALTIFLLALAVYLLTLSPSIVVDDGGELQMLAHQLGVAHPTGYPLFLLLGWIFAHLPLPGDVALQVTLMSTFASALSMSLLYLLARELGVGRAAAAAAALLLATAPRIWMHATAAEVYGLANVFMVLGLWLLLRWGAGKTSLWIVTLAFGFGLTHHIFLRLVGPAAAIYVLALEPKLLLHPRRWLPALLALLAPLLLYALLPLRAGYFLAQPAWSGQILGIRTAIASGLITPHYFGGLDNLVLALDYSSQFFNSAALGLNILGEYARMTLDQVPLPALLLAILGVLVLLRRDRKASALFLVTYLVVMFAALKFLAEVGEDGDNFIPVYLLMAVWFAVGVDAVLKWARRQRVVYAVLLLLLWLLPIYNLIDHLPAALDRRQTEVRLQAEALLAEPLPPAAVIVGDWTDVTPLRYLQRVENVRPDLWIIHADALGVSMLAERALAQAQPYFVLRDTPAGLRLLPIPAPIDAAIAHADERRLNEFVRWSGYNLSPERATAGGVIAITFFWSVDETPPADWSTFIHLLAGNDEKVAQVDRMPVADFYPPTRWQPGQLIADPYELVLPPDLEPGHYQLIFGAYSGDARFEWADGSAVQPLAEIVIE